MASPLPTLIPNIRSALFARLDENQRDVHFRRLQLQAEVRADDEAWVQTMKAMKEGWQRDKAKRAHAKAMQAMKVTAAVIKVMKDVKASKD
jgi:hypothetical protein